MQSSLICTLMVAIIFMKMSGYIIVSNTATSIIGSVLYLAVYFLLLRLAKDLKKKEIHGINAIVWASFMIIIVKATLMGASATWKSAIWFLMLLFYIYKTIDGVIRLLMSVFYVCKKNDVEHFEKVEAWFSCFVTIVSIVVTVISLI